MKTYRDLPEFKEYDERDFSYEPELTLKLDNNNNQLFGQETINEIILWKISRYAALDPLTLEDLNLLDSKADKIDNDTIKKILYKLLKTKGIRLPVASTILRFKNPNVFQIIDQRAYRFLYGENLVLKDLYSEKIYHDQIALYMKYLNDLKKLEVETNWPFKYLDRILYLYDKKINAENNIKYL